MWVCFLHKSEIVKVSKQLTDHIIKSGYNIQDWKVKYWCGSKLDLVGGELDQVMSMWGRTRWEQTRYGTKPTATGCQTQLNTIYWIESDWVWLSLSSNSHKVRSSIWFDCQTQWNSIHGLSLLEFDLQTFNWLCWNNFICNSVLIMSVKEFISIILLNVYSTAHHYHSKTSKCDWHNEKDIFMLIFLQRCKMGYDIWIL